MSETSPENAVKRQIPLKNKESSGANAAPSLSNSDLLSSLGPSKTLPAGVREKMEGSFGMSLSDVKLFESPVVAENGAQAAASGKNIAFAPGKLDFTSTSGQTLLGHELSHVASQARGEVTGSGYLKNPSLEHRADVEGAAAAAGETLYSAGDLSPMSADTGLSTGPMQASKSEERSKAKEKRQLVDYYNKLDPSGQIDLLANLSVTMSTNESKLSKAELEFITEKIKTATPEFSASIIDRQSSFSTEYMQHFHELETQYAGKGSLPADGGKTQGQADSDRASLDMLSSEYGDKFMSYQNLIMQVRHFSDNNSENERATNERDNLASKQNPDFARAGTINNSSLNEISYATPNADAFLNERNQQTTDRIANPARPWQKQKKKKPWWHFW